MRLKRKRYRGTKDTLRVSSIMEREAKCHDQKKGSPLRGDLIAPSLQFSRVIRALPPEECWKREEHKARQGQVLSNRFPILGRVPQFSWIETEDRQLLAKAWPNRFETDEREHALGRTMMDAALFLQEVLLLRCSAVWHDASVLHRLQATLPKSNGVEWN